MIIILMITFMASAAIAQLTTTFVGSSGNAIGPPPTCAGVIDLSVGCAIGIVP
jgi:hypothetical protein